MRVLVADDEASARLLLKHHLSGLGTIDEAEDGAETLQAVEAALAGTDPYGLICLDIYMPVLNGLDCLSRIRDLERDYHMPNVSRIVVTTSINDRAVVLTAYQRQCEGYLLKPIDCTRLAWCLRKQGIRLPPPSGLTRRITADQLGTESHRP